MLTSSRHPSGMRSQAIYIKKSLKRKYSLENEKHCKVIIKHQKKNLDFTPIAQTNDVQSLFDDTLSLSPIASSPNSVFEPPCTTKAFLQSIVNNIKSSANWFVPVFSTLKQSSGEDKHHNRLSKKFLERSIHTTNQSSSKNVYNSKQVDLARRKLFNRSHGPLSLKSALAFKNAPPTSMKKLQDYVTVPDCSLKTKNSIQKALHLYQRERKLILFRSQTDTQLSSETCVSYSHMESYLLLIENSQMISVFLKRDVCRVYADKYLLAMVFSYFVRANLNYSEYNQENFFAALYLAHDMEEEDEDLKYEIFPYCLGVHWRSCYSYLLSIRDDLFWNMNCRSVVSRKCCEQVINLSPNHWLWKRERPEYHNTIERDPRKKRYPQGPWGNKPLWCRKCLQRECLESDNECVIYRSDSTDESEEDDGHSSQESTLEHKSLRLSSSDTSISPKTKRKDSGYESFLVDEQQSNKENKDPNIH